MKKIKHQGNSPGQQMELSEKIESMPGSKPTFKNHHNSKPTKGFVTTQPSKTVPDQTMSIKEILYKYAHGLPLESEKVPIYNGEDEFPDFKRMDISEQHEYLKRNQELINDYNRKKAAAEKKQADEKMEAYYKEKFAEEQKKANPAPSAGNFEPSSSQHVNKS